MDPRGLVVIVVVIVARDVIARILNVGHVDEHLSRARGARAGGFFANAETVSKLQVEVPASPGITADQGAAHQLSSSGPQHRGKYDFLTEIYGKNFGGSGRKSKRGVVTRNYESSYRRVVQFAVFTSTYPDTQLSTPVGFVAKKPAQDV